MGSKNNSDSDSDNGSELGEIDVEFEFSTPSEEDFHGLKTLLKQTFSTDIEKIQDSKLADYIISTAIGNVVKADGNPDPYALCCVIDSHAEVAKPIIEYLNEKSKNDEFSEIWKDRVGIVLNDRLINMPPQIAPPLFEMLMEENDIEYKNIVYISKVYTEVDSTLSEDEDEEEKRPKKKKKVQKESFYFQAEDEFIESFSSHHFDYSLPKQQSSDSRRVFQEAGIEPFRRVLTISFDKMKSIVEKLKQVVV
jgi:protein BCP1